MPSELETSSQLSSLAAPAVGYAEPATSCGVLTPESANAATPSPNQPQTILPSLNLPHCDTIPPVSAVPTLRHNSVPDASAQASMSFGQASTNMQETMSPGGVPNTFQHLRWAQGAADDSMPQLNDTAYYLDGSHHSPTLPEDMGPSCQLNDHDLQFRSAGAHFPAAASGIQCCLHPGDRRGVLFGQVATCAGAPITSWYETLFLGMTLGFLRYLSSHSISKN